MQGTERSVSKTGACWCVPVLAFAFAAIGVDARAEEAVSQPLDLWTSDAPIASVLAFVVDEDTFDLRIANDIKGRVSGRLQGSVSEVLEPLLDQHQLTVHHDGSTVWFDRRDRDVVARMNIDDEGEHELIDWISRELEGDVGNGQGRVTREDGELVIAGTRAFVQDTLSRVSAARSALGEIVSGNELAAGDDVVIEPAAIDAVPEASAPTADTETADGRRYLTVSDVPGFNTDYR